MSYFRIETPYARTIVVGDIHGCIDELQALLELAGFCETDILVSVGDFLDRGPGSWEVARILRDTPNAFSVLGNHERRVAGTVRGTSRPAWSQAQSLSRLDPARHEEWAQYLESLPAVIETPHAIITHARLDPERPLEAQDPHFTAAVGGSRVRIEKDAEGVPLWFGRMSPLKPICIGHVRCTRVELVPGRDRPPGAADRRFPGDAGVNPRSIIPAPDLRVCATLALKHPEGQLFDGSESHSPRTRRCAGARPRSARRAA
jgi:hypothetical protein